MANMASACALVMSSEDNEKLFGPLRHWRARQAASTCILVTVSSICVCILVVCGVLLAREYSLATGYHPAQCLVANVTDTGHERTCHCASSHKDKAAARERVNSGSGSSTNGGASSPLTGPGGCIVSTFPCYRVIVIYTSADSNGVYREALLHLDSIQAIGIHRECSFSVCNHETEGNQRTVHQYVSHWRDRQRDGRFFQCYYNTANSDDVIAEKVYTQSDVVHSMLWPSLVIVICCVIFLRLETRRRNLTFCGRNAPPPTEASPTRDVLDMQAVLRNGGQTGNGFRVLPSVGSSVECRLVSRFEADRMRKPWKSYSSLEHLIVATPTHRKSVTGYPVSVSTVKSRDSQPTARSTEKKFPSADLLISDCRSAESRGGTVQQQQQQQQLVLAAASVTFRISDEQLDDDKVTSDVKLDISEAAPVSN